MVAGALIYLGILMYSLKYRITLFRVLWTIAWLMYALTYFFFPQNPLADPPLQFSLRIVISLFTDLLFFAAAMSLASRASDRCDLPKRRMAKMSRAAYWPIMLGTITGTVSILTALVEYGRHDYAISQTSLSLSSALQSDPMRLIILSATSLFSTASLLVQAACFRHVFKQTRRFNADLVAFVFIPFAALQLMYPLCINSTIPLALVLWCVLAFRCGYMTIGAMLLILDRKPRLLNVTAEDLSAETLRARVRGRRASYLLALIICLLTIRNAIINYELPDNRRVWFLIAVSAIVFVSIFLPTLPRHHTPQPTAKAG